FDGPADHLAGGTPQRDEADRRHETDEVERFAEDFIDEEFDDCEQDVHSVRSLPLAHPSLCGRRLRLLGRTHFAWVGFTSQARRGRNDLTSSPARPAASPPFL